MDPDLFRRVRDIVLRARDLPPGESRTTFLDDCCGGDADLRREVESLLAQQQEPSILEPGRVADEVARNLNLPQPPSADDRIGPYRLIELLGQGGMGVVYHARQEEPIVRDVALKLIGWSLVSESMRARFQAEREALARMDHPNIARVLDAGETTHGRPYVVMELVRGEPITRYCDRQQLTVRQRVELLARVCLAVHHAHQKGVLHRDLKPSNIMVEEIDGEAVPKLIDFGIAKSLQADEALTLAGQLVGTPEYMSPEQAGESETAIDTRSDIYSLGIVLHELLVGDLPVGRDTLKGKPPTEIQRILRQHEPRRPSTRLKTISAAQRDEVGRARGTSATRVAREVQGDLDWVTLKAVARDPAERYSSASELAAELRRFLQHQPVEAGPPTRTAQLRKFVRRNRTVVTVGSLLFAVLLVGVIGTTWQWRNARQQADLAQTRLDAVNDFAISFVDDVDREVAQLPNSTPARRTIAQMLVNRLDELSTTSGDQRGIENALSRGYDRLTYIHLDLGESEEALAANEKAIAFAQALVTRRPGEASPRNSLGLRYSRRAGLLRRAGDAEGALDYYTRAITTFEEVLRDHPDYDLAQRNLATYRGSAGWVNYEMGRIPQARELLEGAVVAMTAVRDAIPDDHRGWGNLGNLQARLGMVLNDHGETEAAEAALRASIATLDDALGRFPEQEIRIERERLVSYGRLAQILQSQGRLEEAIAASRVTEEMAARGVERFPNRLRERTNLATARGDIAAMLMETGDLAGSREAYRSALRALKPLPEGSEPTEFFRGVVARIHRGLARVSLELEDLPTMKEQLLAAYQIDKELTAADPANFAYANALLRDQAFLAEYYSRVGGERENLDSLQSAAGWIEQAQAQARSMRERGMGRSALEDLEARLQRLEATNDSLLTALDSR